MRVTLGAVYVAMIVLFCLFSSESDPQMVVLRLLHPLLAPLLKRSLFLPLLVTNC